jgi:hypothetical protein
VAIAVLSVVVGVVVIGSLAEINAQSAGYRRQTDAAYGQLASVVVADSNQTGSRLSALMASAGRLADGPVAPNPSGVQPLSAGTSTTARARLQQGLDEAVRDSADEAARAAALVPPYPTGSVSQRLVDVMRARAAGAATLRTVIDGLLGMSPLPVAGSPPSPSPASPPAPVPVASASARLTAVGRQLVDADSGYAGLRAYIRHSHLPVGLPASVWVPEPTAVAPLGPLPLAAAASSLAASASLAPVHQMVITAASLSPPAVTTGGSGLITTDCSDPSSTGVATTPTVLPPTATLDLAATVTNCGTVTETGVTVTQTLTLADPAGTPPPPTDARGGENRTRVTLVSGGSVALDLPGFTVATGHRYDIVLAIAVPPGQVATAGATQAFLVQIAA